LLSGYPVLCRGRAIQLSDVAVCFNGLVDDLVHHVWRRLSFSLMRQSYALAVVSVMRSGLREFGIPGSKYE
jgi:hypothetical protein